MKRFFNKKQRIAIELNALGVCQSCGISLPKHWHSDHIIPFSKGGVTDVINGQALCPDCNLKKGNKMKKIILRNWQQRALNQSINEFNNGKKLFLTQATPGGGKTIHGLSVFESTQQSHVVILAPSTVLVKQWQEDAKKFYGIELKTSMLYSGQSDFDQYQGMVMTYQGMNENHENLRMFCEQFNPLIISDEMHHVADGQSWGDSFRNAFGPASNILGLTGTPWASKGKRIAFVSYDKEGYSMQDFSYSKETAIVENVCRITEFHGMKPRNLMFVDNDTGNIDYHETLEDAVDAGVRGAYSKTLSSLQHFKSLFIDADQTLKSIRETTHDAGGLIVAPSIKIAHQFKDEVFALTGEDYRIVHSKSDKPHKSIKDFKNSNERWLISVDMVTEGVDIKRLQTCVFLSTKNTELFLRQVIGRIERRRNKLSRVDKFAYFYYTDTPELKELISRFEDENKAGLALVEELENETNNEEGNGEKERFNDSLTLEEVTTEMESLTAEGFDFPIAVIREAMSLKRSDPSWLNEPTYVICKIILAQYRQKKEETSTEYADEYDAPVEIKTSRLRQAISKEVNRKLMTIYGKNLTGREISIAHNVINRCVGIDKTDNSTSIELLEAKLEYINISKAQSWV